MRNLKKYYVIYFFISILIQTTCLATLQRLPIIGELPQENNEKLLFAVLGDKTSGGDGQWEIFDRAIESINLLCPDFVITVGDHIPGHMEDKTIWQKEWEQFLSHAKRLTVPLFLVPGNHDIANQQCYKFWEEDFGSTYYYFLFKNYLFIVLNTEEERWDGRGPKWQAMMNFALNTLSSHTNVHHTFLFFHKPMWDDPRFQEDWKIIEDTLKSRKYTAIAGHEHYLMTQQNNENLLVIQSATGGGLVTSPIRQYGAFHSVGIVTALGQNVSYAVLDPFAGIFPATIAPSWFRKTIATKVVTIDTEKSFVQPKRKVRLPLQITLYNPFEETIEIKLSIQTPASEWRIQKTKHIQKQNNSLLTTLAPNTMMHIQSTLVAKTEKIYYPPLISWAIKMQGAWLLNEHNPMVQENIPLLFPKSVWRVAPEWLIAGPFKIGPIDTKFLPDYPEKANSLLFHRFGPETGYYPPEKYENKLEWRKASANLDGLLNFNAILGTVDEAVAYAACAIFTPIQQKTFALVYSDNYHQGFLNGNLIPEGQDFGTPSGFTYIPLDLNPGWNSFVIKLINNRADWFLRILFADPHKNLSFACIPTLVENL